jgi:hypothetical protein
MALHDVKCANCGEYIGDHAHIEALHCLKSLSTKESDEDG